MYCIALDDIKCNSEDEMSHNFLYGDPKNRWFDKNYTIMVDKNGVAALNFEHSWGDGVAVLRLFNELYDDSTKNKFVTPDTKPSVNKNNLVKKLGKPYSLTYVLDKIFPAIFPVYNTDIFLEIH